jgi:hypothetical protein|tara:strand:- start:456 stop:662 length:207 start_codon:yes stop_codon:yes gene_type:complete
LLINIIFRERIVLEKMVIKKIFKLINKTEQKNPFQYRGSVITSVRAKSTATGRSKVKSLKKIGREKRR